MFHRRLSQDCQVLRDSKWCHLSISSSLGVFVRHFSMIASFPTCSLSRPSASSTPLNGTRSPPCVSARWSWLHFQSDSRHKTDQKEAKKEKPKEESESILEFTEQVVQAARKLTVWKEKNSVTKSGIRAEDFKGCDAERIIFNKVVMHESIFFQIWKRVTISVLFKKGDVERTELPSYLYAANNVQSVFNTSAQHALPQAWETTTPQPGGIRRSFQTLDHPATYGLPDQEGQEWGVKMWIATVLIAKASETIRHDAQHNGKLLQGSESTRHTWTSGKGYAQMSKHSLDRQRERCHRDTKRDEEGGPSELFILQHGAPGCSGRWLEKLALVGLKIHLQPKLQQTNWGYDRQCHSGALTKERESKVFRTNHNVRATSVDWNKERCIISRYKQELTSRFDLPRHRLRSFSTWSSPPSSSIWLEWASTSTRLWVSTATGTSRPSLNDLMRQKQSFPSLVVVQWSVSHFASTSHCMSHCTCSSVS